MHYVSGNNLFGQWCTNSNIYSEFTKITNDQLAQSVLEKENIKLLAINWAHNVIKICNDYYLFGAWKGIANQCKLLPIQEGEDSVIIAANDFYIFIVKSTSKLILMFNLENEEIKTINLNLECPLEQEQAVKKSKIEDKICKVSVANESVLYLTSEGLLYSGIMPSYIDTSHCDGKIVDAQCGYEHFIILTDTGLVYTWGNGRRLQLGHGDVNNEECPTLVEALSGIKIKKISAGGWHSLALSEYGDVYAWGWNDSGQIGIYEKETLSSYSVPTLVELFHESKEYDYNAVNIACGSRHSAILLDDNSVWTTGNNKYGQLGIGTKDYVQYFQKSFQCSNKSTLFCGYWTTVIISE